MLEAASNQTPQNRDPPPATPALRHCDDVRPTTPSPPTSPTRTPFPRVHRVWGTLTPAAVAHPSHLVLGHLSPPPPHRHCVRHPPYLLLEHLMHTFRMPILRCRIPPVEQLLPLLFAQHLQTVHHRSLIGRHPLDQPMPISRVPLRRLSLPQRLRVLHAPDNLPARLAQVQRQVELRHPVLGQRQALHL